MKYLGNRTLETNRLILKAQTINEQRKLWKILMIPEVNKYFLTVPVKFRDKLLNWSKQEGFYKEDMKDANDNEVFRWSIFLKSTRECIGRINCHETHDEEHNITNPAIRGIGCLIAPKYHGNGYGTEAATVMPDYMFNYCDIDKIITGAAIYNPAS